MRETRKAMLSAPSAPIWSFLTHEDVRELPGNENKLIFAVHAPVGSKLELPLQPNGSSTSKDTQPPSLPADAAAAAQPASSSSLPASSSASATASAAAASASVPGRRAGSHVVRLQSSEGALRISFITPLNVVTAEPAEPAPGRPADRLGVQHPDEEEDDDDDDGLGIAVGLGGDAAMGAYGLGVSDAASLLRVGNALAEAALLPASGSLRASHPSSNGRGGMGRWAELSGAGRRGMSPQHMAAARDIWGDGAGNDPAAISAHTTAQLSLPTTWADSLGRESPEGELGESGETLVRTTLPQLHYASSRASAITASPQVRLAHRQAVRQATHPPTADGAATAALSSPVSPYRAERRGHVRTDSEDSAAVHHPASGDLSHVSELHDGSELTRVLPASSLASVARQGSLGKALVPPSFPSANGSRNRALLMAAASSPPAATPRDAMRDARASERRAAAADLNFDGNELGHDEQGEAEDLVIQSLALMKRQAP